MSLVKNINIEDYNYDLPDERIAKFPLTPRDSSKLLIRREDQMIETVFNRIPAYIPDDSLLVFNNTKVIQARMIFRKATGAQIEIFCLEPHQPADYAQAFIQNKSCQWICLIGNAKRWKNGKLYRSLSDKEDVVCSVERLESYGETHLVQFEWNNPDLSFANILERLGELPIPPYLNRKTEESDKETYQTVYSKIKGSVAAPTAGLHFTEEVFGSLRKKNVDLEELTLHVGAGTFKPVKSATIADHEMHTECISIKRETIEKLLTKEGKIIAVGTTSVRTLESLYYIGTFLEEHPEASSENLSVSQWTPYAENRKELTTIESLNNILKYMDKSGLNVLTSHTQILIAPGYQFKIVNGIITNFHQPKSTLLLLISAFVKGNWKEVYDYALNHDFRFLSYGDSSLLM
ncbi:S-adenosylmethionine:tRNA ribosyltransferase-isomerase [Bacteroidales bacterium OttesenSCG-928-M06]|nr:S-adenosylmethionine:tRNA ribosyltransferase-isomerase [Bacteroidales bacterium OttesenSCG-928-M06]